MSPRADRRAGPGLGWALLPLCLASCAREPPRSLLLVSLDTLRADRLGSYGSTRGLTPHLDALAAESTVFEDVTCSVPLTTPSHASLFTSRSPAAHGIHTNESASLAPGVVTLAQHLRERGYRTAGFVAAQPLASRTGLGRGFESWDDGFLRTPGVAERPATDVLAAALSDLERRAGSREPFFVFVHLFDAHSPYQPPQPWRDRFADAPYDGEVAALDAALGDFFDAVRRTGLLERALVSVVADHGESLGEHGESTHGALLYQATLHVPWLLRMPGGDPAGGRIAAPVRLLDVAPTLLGALGAPPLAGAEGQDLGPLLAGGEPPDLPIASESLYLQELLGWSGLHSLRRGPHKLIVGSRRELFDLAADPLEQHDRSEGDPRRAQALEAELDARGSAAAAASAPSSDALERLAALGYVGGHTETADGGARDPRDGMAIWNEIERGVGLVRSDPTEARAHLERALALDPGNGVALKSLGDVALAQGDPASAAERYRAAEQAGFHHPDLARASAEAERALGHPERALELLGSLPDDPEIAASRARLELELGRPAAALERLAGLPDGAEGDAVALRAQALRALGRAAEAQALLEQRIARRPADAAALIELGVLHAEAGRAAEAERLWRAAAAAAPRAAAPRRNLAGLAADPAERERLLREAIGLDPGFTPARVDLARLLAETGRAREAAAQATAALARAPGDAETLFVAARIAELRGERGEARRLYARFVERAGPGMDDALAMARARLAALGGGG